MRKSADAPFSLQNPSFLSIPLSLQGRKIRNPPPQISAGGRKDLIRVLTNENRAQGSKDLTKQQGLPSKYFFNNNNKNNNNNSNNLKKNEGNPSCLVRSLLP